MHYSRHRLTASLTYVTMLTYESTNDQWARPARLFVNSLKTKPCQFSLVQFSSGSSLWTRLYTLKTQRGYAVLTQDTRLTYSFPLGWHCRCVPCTTALEGV